MAHFDVRTFTPLESMQPLIWGSFIDQNMLADYDQIFQPTSDFYGSTESSTTASPFSDISSPRPESRTTSQNSSELRGVIPDKVGRRREQNRMSQRAYRDRKDKHQRDVEGQLNVWKEKHEKLQKSYAAQTDKVSELKAQIEELNTQIVSLQSDMPDTLDPIVTSPPDFDLVPFYDKKFETWSQKTVGA